jgi:hypothetical protein
MSLHFSWKDPLLLSSWAPKSYGEYFGYLLVALSLACLHQFLARLKITIGSLSKKTIKDVYTREVKITSVALLNTCIKLLEYFLILIVVTGNVGYIVSILCGHFLGQIWF